MSALATVALGAGLVGIAVATYTGVQLRIAKRERYIREFAFPQGLYKKLQVKRPEIDPKYHALIARALRQFFLYHLKGGKRFVSMPSQVVDDLWHEFILFTRNYQLFCDKAFGGYMHHSPAVALGKGQTDDVGLKRTWRQACKEENINPSSPSRLPLLFAIDEKLGIKDGFRYVPDCSNASATRDVHCGAHLGSGCGGGSDGGSCSGGSCGGGGCGGD